MGCRDRRKHTQRNAHHYIEHCVYTMRPVLPSKEREKLAKTNVFILVVIPMRVTHNNLMFGCAAHHVHMYMCTCTYRVDGISDFEANGVNFISETIMVKSCTHYRAQRYVFSVFTHDSKIHTYTQKHNTTFEKWYNNETWKHVFYYLVLSYSIGVFVVCACNAFSIEPIEKHFHFRYGSAFWKRVVTVLDVGVLDFSWIFIIISTLVIFSILNLRCVHQLNIQIKLPTGEEEKK